MAESADSSVLPLLPSILHMGQLRVFFPSCTDPRLMSRGCGELAGLYYNLKAFSVVPLSLQQCYHCLLSLCCSYVASGSTAVLIHSDGSASLSWPEGSMAATLDPEEPPPAGSIASSSGFPSGSSVAPIKGYRLLAMYRTVTGVAASFDSSGGFVQWPNGNLMLVWNKRDGTAYSPDGRATHNFTSRRWGTGVACTPHMKRVMILLVQQLDPCRVLAVC